MKALVVALLAMSMALAGCNHKDGSTPPGATPDLKSGKGAINGLLVDDVFRPVPSALILASNGLTATTDGSGQFSLINLEPGAYILRIQATGYEAAPQTFDVKAGEYTEAELLARRVLNQGSRIATNEFSVFVPCAAGFIVNGITANCVLDLSGDSFRSSFTSNLTAQDNITFMVTEWKFNQVGDWNVQIREDDGSASGGERYGTLDIAQGDYARVVLELDVLNEEANAQRNNVVWNNTKPFATGIFLNGQFKQEAQDVYDTVPVCSTGQQGGVNVLCTATGAGVTFGVRARIIQSVFIGEPEVDPLTYGVLD